MIDCATDFTHRPVKGFAFVGNAGTRTKRAISTRVDLSLAFARTLQPKSGSKKTSRGLMAAVGIGVLLGSFRFVAVRPPQETAVGRRILTYG